MHLHELMGWPGPMTHRQFVAWQYWLDEQLSMPSRSDNYLMQIACEVRRVLSKRPNKIQVKDFHIRFGKPQPVETTPESQQHMLNAAKSRWVASVGKPVKIVHVTRESLNAANETESN